MMDVAWAQTGGAVQPNDPRVMFFNFLPLILVFVIFYFLILRPQSKRQKDLQKMIQGMKKGDRVLTSGGLYGEVVDVKEKGDTVILKVAENVKMEFAKSAVTGVAPRGES
jgi:preprotein translocase subunit YajC